MALLITCLFLKAYPLSDFVTFKIPDQASIIVSFVTTVSLVFVVGGLFLNFQQNHVEKKSRQLETFILILEHTYSRLNRIEAEIVSLSNITDYDEPWNKELYETLRKSRGTMSAILLEDRIRSYMKIFEWLQMRAGNVYEIKKIKGLFLDGTHQAEGYKFFKGIMKS